MIAHWPSLSETNFFWSTLPTLQLAVYGRNEMPQGTRGIVGPQMNESQWVLNERSRGRRSLTVVLSAVNQQARPGTYKQRCHDWVRHDIVKQKMKKPHAVRRCWDYRQPLNAN